jgi:DNA-binding transcriptional ArsR family regulator
MDVYTETLKYPSRYSIQGVMIVGTRTVAPQKILETLQDNPSGLTVKQITKATGFNECSVRVALRTLLAAGHVKEAGMVDRNKVYCPC